MRSGCTAPPRTHMTRSLVVRARRALSTAAVAVTTVTPDCVQTASAAAVSPARLLVMTSVRSAGNPAERTELRTATTSPRYPSASIHTSAATLTTDVLTTAPLPTALESGDALASADILLFIVTPFALHVVRRGNRSERHEECSVENARQKTRSRLLRASHGTQFRRASTRAHPPSHDLVPADQPGHHGLRAAARTPQCRVSHVPTASNQPSVASPVVSPRALPEPMHPDIHSLQCRLRSTANP